MAHAKAPSNLTQRIVSSIILAPAVIYMIIIGGVAFQAMILVMAILMAFEWNHMTSTGKPDRWYAIGIFYILMPSLSLIWIRSRADGMFEIFWLLAIVWSTDIGGYFAGRFIGGPKLAPSISPKKTWSGLVGGVILALFVTNMLIIYTNAAEAKQMLIVSFVLSIYSVIGDLIESWIKRRFDVKDSGNIIPGHGGILDRVDGIVTTAPKLALFLLYEGASLF